MSKARTATSVAAVLVAAAITLTAVTLPDPAHANRTAATTSSDANRELVFYRERNPTHSVLDVRVLRRGRTMWARLTELRPQAGERATWPVVTTELHRGCQSNRPTARTREPRGGGTVRSPRPIYCLLPRNTARDGNATRHVILTSLGAESDTVQADSLPRTVALQVSGGAGPDLVGGGAGNDTLCAGVSAIPVDSEGYASGCATAPGDTPDEFQTDVVFGGQGDDTLLGDGLPNALHGGEGDDEINGGEGGDLEIGDQGADTLRGDGGDDLLDVNWFEGVEAEQEKVWTAGSDTLDGGTGKDTVGYTFLTTPVNATSTSATISAGFARGTDHFGNIEKLFLSKSDDTFTSPPAAEFEVQGMAGNDNIEIAGDPSREYNQLAYCGEGDDHVSIDVNRIPDGPTGPAILPGSEIMEDGSNGCESTTYRAAR